MWWLWFKIVLQTVIVDSPLVAVLLRLFCVSLYSITLNQTERGLVPPIEHIGHPSHIREEMGMGNTSRLQNVPWWNSSYLHERREHLQDVIDEMDPHMPVCSNVKITL